MGKDYWDSINSVSDSRGNLIYKPKTLSGEGGWSSQQYTDAAGNAQTIYYDQTGRVFQQGIDNPQHISGMTADGTAYSTFDGGNIGNGATNSDFQWLGEGGALQTGAQVTNALSGLAGAYTGLENLKLAKKSFDFNKQLTNRNLQNQGLAYNTALDDRTRIAQRLGGSTKAESDAAVVANTTKKMNTSAIG